VLIWEGELIRLFDSAKSTPACFVVAGIVLVVSLGIPFAAASVRVANGQKPVEIIGRIVTNQSRFWFPLA
jgi:hypothetical protein